MSKSADLQQIYKNDALLKREDVKSLQEWADKQAHLPQITELQAMLFLQSCYYSNEQAKTALDNFFTVRTLCPDIFANRNPKDKAMQQAVNVGLVSMLPKKTPEGYVVIYMKLMDCDPEKYNYANQIRYFDMAIMLYLHQHGPCNGILLVFDMQGTVFGHLTRMSLIIMKKFLYYLQEAMPIRLKGLHIINTVSFMDKLLAMIKPFMKKEMMDMLNLHTDSVNSLYKSVPQECLPKEYGGSADSVTKLHEQTKKLFNSNADFFKAEEAQKVDETKRAGKPKSAGDFFGVEGTFKKLEVD